MLLKELTEANGVSGREKEVRGLIRQKISSYVDEIRTDSIGNLIAHKKGDSSKPTIMLTAHMDEIGLMITDITKDGLLKFKPIGGIDKRVLVSKQVLVGEDRIPGVIGAKAIHLQEPEEREQPLDYKSLYIDIGAKDKEEGEKLVDLGTMATFNTKYKRLGAKTAKGKAFDDRIGCAALIELLQEDYNLPLYAVFTAQEEVGTRGASIAAYNINPDLALVLEGTTASDVPGSEEEDYSTSLGQGPAFTVQDGSVIPHKTIVNKLIEIAEKEKINYQFRRSTAAGNDAGAIHLTREGIPSGVISVPCRYIHSPVSLVNLDDYQRTIKLTKLFCQEVAKGGIDDERIS
ncbi:peptidase family protein [Halobacteroides halobius DSM 5150]|uniref:Peptidase family protein n=1 Tax=Halobacteroides halobius (strain ATCC 35273 / DSM 5150 / MD-1) TaxID=748449 RepID=L0KB77_HALHC|nr:M42 family metallopeptidase [Halobacteroides halobius]AGB41318.1 peptidase family protein [Halobacteroides halobius DSM 5150]